MGRPRKLLWLRIALPVVVVIASAVTFFVHSAKSPDNAAVGDCLNIKDFKEGSEPAKADCADPAANVKIAVRLDSDTAGCPEGDYDEYSVTGDTSYKLCLTPNDKVGECVANFSSDSTQGYKHVDCADPTAEVKVVKIADGVADESGCDGTDATSYRTYSNPKSTYCYTDLKRSST